MTTEAVTALLVEVLEAAAADETAARKAPTAKGLQEVARRHCGDDTRHGDGAKLMRLYLAARWAYRVHTKGDCRS